MRYRHNHKEKITRKRRKAAVAYYRKLKSEKKNADKQRRDDQNITSENAVERIQSLKESIRNLIEVAGACDFLGIEIPKRVYDQADDKIGFKRGWLDHYCSLTYKNNGCEILYFYLVDFHLSFCDSERYSWLRDEISDVNTDILVDFIQNYVVFESAFYKWFDELVGIQHTI